MAYQEEISRHLDRLDSEVAELEKRLIQDSKHNQARADAIWQDLMHVSDQVSQEWHGPSAVEEIASQREK